MVAKEFRLDGKKALVAGDGRFWPREAAGALAEAGADVAIVSGRADTAEEAAANVQRLGRRGVAFRADLTKSTQVEDMVERAVREMGRIDILVNAGGMEFAKPVLDIAKGEWQRAIDANLTPVFLCCQAVGKEMMSQKKGRIINITSCLAERGLINSSAYCAAAAGIVAFTRTLALEWADEGVTVNAIGAGWFAETDRTGAPQEDALLRFLPMRRYGHPGEIGSLVVYLASNATDFITGQFLYADGAAMCHL